MVSMGQLKEISERIAHEFDPERVILFGSHARGDATEISDVDLLVVANTDLPPSKRYAAVRRVLANYPASFDIVVKTPDEYARWRNVVNHVVYFADKYGKLLYERGNPGSGPTVAREDRGAQHARPATFDRTGRALSPGAWQSG